MVLTVLNGVALGASSPTNPVFGLAVSGLVASPNSHGVVQTGQNVQFYGNITGGLLYNWTICSAGGSSAPGCSNGFSNLSQPGWHLYWFFGIVNDTTNVTNVTAYQQHILPPTSCAPPSGPQTTKPYGCMQGPGGPTGYVPIHANHTYSRAGDYAVSLTAYDGNFDWVIATTELTVVAPAFKVRINSIQSIGTPNGTASPVEGFPIQFNGTCLNGTVSPHNCTSVALAWNFGDGSFAYGPIVYHTYDVRGTYIVTLTGIDSTSEGMNRTFATVYVTNLAPWGSIGSTSGSLTGPIDNPFLGVQELFGYLPANPPGTKMNATSSFPTRILGPWSLHGVWNVTVGTPLDVCSLAFDFNPLASSSLTFQWHFGDGTVTYSRVGSESLIHSGLPCETPSMTYQGGVIFGATPPTIPSEVSIASHVYECPGWYNITVELIDQEGLNSNSTPYRITIHAVPWKSPTSGIPQYNTTVGQVDLLNASLIPNFPSQSAFYNMTWNAGKLGPTYGTVGRIMSFRAVRQALTLTTTANTSALPCCSSTPVTTSTFANVFDVKPTVGIDSFYTEATITLTVENPSAYNNLNFTLLENGVNEGWYNLSYPSSSVTFQPVDFQMANHWAIRLNYTPYGQSGGTYVDVAFAWTDDNTAIDGFDSTESPEASDTVSVFFSNSNTSKQNSNTFSVNQQAVGEPVFGEVVFFSPAQTNLTETWKFGYGSPQTTHDSAPSQPGPTMSTWQFEVAYNYGATYTFNVSACDDYNYCSGDQITVTNTNTLIVSDTAPFISLTTTSPTTVEGAIDTIEANVQNQDNATGNATVTWSWGDGTNSTNSTGNYFGQILYGVHIYRYSSKYAIVVTATSPLGSSSVNWTWITVRVAPPLTRFGVVTPSPYVDEPVWFSGANSSDSVAGAVGMSFGWIFGNSQWTGGQGIPAMVVSTTYPSAGTYHVTLLTQTSEGVVGSITKTVNVTTIPITRPYPSIPNGSATADQFFAMRGNISGTTFGEGLPLLNVTWSWGDGSPESYGVSTGHTYVYPGVYSVAASFTAPGATGTYTAHAAIRVYDGASPILSIPFQGTELYGQSSKLPGGFMPTNLSAWVLGDYADQGKNWNFTWNYGDGSNTQSTHGGSYSSEVHDYNYSGALTLAVNTSGPWASLGAAAASATLYLTDAPVSAEDGLPNEFAKYVAYVSPFSAEPGLPFGQFYGTGCTQYVGPNCEAVPGIGSFNGDDGGCGLTNIEAILGTVTGFASDPLECSTSGDGVPDAAHFYSDSFQANQVVPFSPNNNSLSFAAVAQIPGVQYLGPAIAFNQSTLDVELSYSGSLSSLTLYLVGPEGQVISLGSPTGAESTFTLASGNPSTSFYSVYASAGFSLSDLSAAGTWGVELVDAGTASGTIVASTFTVSYYTNPGLADSLKQGMLDGHSVTTPVFNCSNNAATAKFPVFNPGTFHAYNVSYLPYSETYWKLSVDQGVPYVWGNGTYTSINNPENCTRYGVPQSLWNASATYLGDADFGISPWNPDASGDPGLTNGMKALGTHAYMMTRGQYMSFSAGGGYSFTGDNGGPYNNNVSISYPTDHLTTYAGPLNPTAYSTAGDGVADNAAPDPVAPLGLEVTIKSATDGNCYLLAGLGPGPEDIASVTLLTPSGQNEPTIYTPARFGSGPSGCDNFLGVNWGNDNYNFTFSSSYFFAIPNSQSTFTLQFNLWQNETLTAAPPRATVTVTGQVKAGAWANATGSIFATAQVVPLNRLPVILVNKTGEIENLPGYGYRYVGEQRFYAFDLNMGTTGVPAPFSSGTNIILESRTSLLNSSANLTLLNNPRSLAMNLTGCAPLGGANVTAPSGATASLDAIQLTISGSVAGSASCGTSLLRELAPLNGSGKAFGGEYIALNSVQLELLGLDSGALLLAPFTAPSGYNSPSGTPPVNVLSQIATAVQNAVNAIQGAVLALANFIASLPALVESFGQSLLGALNSVATALKAVVSAVVSAFEAIFRAIIAAAQVAFAVLLTTTAGALKVLIASIAVPVLGLLANNGNLTWNTYNSTIATMGWHDPSVPAEVAIEATFATAGLAILAFAAGFYIADQLIETDAQAALPGVGTAALLIIADDLPNVLEAALISTLLKTVVSGLAAVAGTALIASMLSGNTYSELKIGLGLTGIGISVGSIALDLVTRTMLNSWLSLPDFAPGVPQETMISGLTIALMGLMIDLAELLLAGILPPVAQFVMVFFAIVLGGIGLYQETTSVSGFFSSFLNPRLYPVVTFAAAGGTMAFGVAKALSLEGVI